MSGQWGLKTETTWGTPVVVDQFVPILSSTLNVDEGWMRPAGKRASRRTQPPASRGARVLGGTIDMELHPVTIATQLKHYFGVVNTTGSGPYTHTYTPGTLIGDSFTHQTGINDAADTIQPFTAEGTKISSWTIGAAVGEFAKTSFEWTAEDVVTATGLASASYASGLVPFTFVECSVTVNGSAVASARSATLSCNMGLKTDRHVLGSRLIRQQLEQDHRTFQTQITSDFDDLTLYALQVAGTQVASVLTFNNGTNTLTITCSGQVSNATPSLSTNGLEENTITLDHSHATSDASAITAVLVSTTESTAP